MKNKLNNNFLLETRIKNEIYAKHHKSSGNLSTCKEIMDRDKKIKEETKKILWGIQESEKEKNRIDEEQCNIF